MMITDQALASMYAELKAKAGYSRPLKKFNKKMAVKDYLNSFQVKFDMEDDAMDLRTMADNYEHGIIPLDDIHTGLNVLSGHSHAVMTEYDPSAPENFSPKFAYVEWNELYLMPIFQRDVMKNHINKILRDFDHSCIIVPCAIKLTVNGKTIYAIWDGHHTLQVCRFQGYTRFPIWYIDVDAVTDEQLTKAGFGTTPEERMRYGVFRAGTNMRNINSKNKAQLNPYDDFMIGVETGDPDLVAIQRIYDKYNIVARRKPQNFKGQIAITQHKTAQECYYLETSNGSCGHFLDRALNFHTTTWKSPIVMEVFRPMAYLYFLAHQQGIKLDATFDKEFGDLLKNRYGDAESAQLKIKESIYLSATNGGGTGAFPDKDKDRVLAGFINLYRQHINRLPAFLTAAYQWQV